MITVTKIATLDGIIELIKEQKYNSSLNRYRSSFLYRGMPNSSFELKTGLQRYCKSKKSCIEKPMLRNFTKYALMSDPKLNESVWRQLIIGQHHGLPTRLLDWTYSPLVGLHFATSGEDLTIMEQHDGVLWKLDIEELNSQLPDKYKRKLEQESAYFFTIDMLDSVCKDLREYDQDMKGDSMIVFEPPSIDQRIISQYSYFLMVPNTIDDLEKFLNSKTNNTVKYIINKKLCWRIRDLLDQMNINERVIYPGLDGLTAWLKRHYYVKEESNDNS